ncbi:YlbL family protein [Corynebacterium caspium]|uniref:YlbL family protein n=1 Tax=Corynebacterium caspium TaxID=234828 RepID=UPI00038208E2|nr:PDZ domain-containing protein [Corynebacterium caspium]WKD59684.1 DNA-binding ATP-dependent protease La [Corynebacterium caspium DSM 44850]
MKRLFSTIALGAVPVVVLTFLVSADHVPGTNIPLTVPYAAQAPGPIFNTLGKIEESPVVEVSGVPTYDTSGELNMTTVSVFTNMTLAQAISRWLIHGDDLIPIEQIFPPDMSQEEVNQSNKIAFNNSEANATVAALNYLGKELKVQVMGVLEDAPVVGKLAEGDIITAVDNAAVHKPSEVKAAILAKKPGDKVLLTVENNGKQRVETITLGANPGLPSEAGKPEATSETAFLGVLMSSRSADGIDIDYHLNEVGGPSAGMIFSLAVIDKLTPGELTAGEVIAGTGTISEDGTVGPIGGIAHKIKAAEKHGAKLFLAPSANCKEALSVNAKDMVIARVDKLTDAVNAISEFHAGKEIATCNS